MNDKLKQKLKRRGNDIYKRYFFNPDNVIERIIKQYDSKEIIDETECEVIFDIPIDLDTQRYELIMYYPNKLKEIKYINENIIDMLYSEYGETMHIMRQSKSLINVRGKLSNSAKDRARLYNIPCNITSEDIKLVKECPYLNILLEYGNNAVTNYSASLDRIKPELGYVKGNIQVISMLANSMKSSATQEQLITFANNIIKS